MIKKIIQEILDYRTGDYEISEGVNFSAYKLLKRISYYKNEIYPTGKFDSQGNYKYWFNIIAPRVAAEIKNIDFDTKDIMLFSDTPGDAMKVLISNAALHEWLHETDQAEKINEAVEQGPEWGTVIWKKDIEKGYRIMDITNVMVLNQGAKSIHDSDVIEEQCLYSSDLRKMGDVWEVNDLLESSKGKEETGKKAEFYIYERNGEISEKDYFLEKKTGKEGRDDITVLAKVVVGGIDKDSPTHVLYCEEIKELPYKEFHRSTYQGRFLRVGLYERLMDIQTRANEIGNQIARGLEWASKTVFRSTDKLIAQNILTDLQSGDIIKSTDLAQVEVRMQGLDQLIADWNRLMTLADQLANSYEVVTGGSLPSGTPFALGQQMNVNANKLFDFIREKLSLALQDVIETWVLPKAIKDIRAKDVLRLTGETGELQLYYKALVDDWYIENLISFPPHNDEIGQQIRDDKMQELMKDKEAIVKLEKEMWEDFEPRVRVTITGENYNLAAELETLQSFITLEQDPIRRTALIELAMKKKGMNVDLLPKTPPAPPQQPKTEQPMETKPQ